VANSLAYLCWRSSATLFAPNKKTKLPCTEFGAFTLSIRSLLPFLHSTAGCSGVKEALWLCTRNIWHSYHALQDMHVKASCCHNSVMLSTELAQHGFSSKPLICRQAITVSAVQVVLPGSKTCQQRKTYPCTQSYKHSTLLRLPLCLLLEACGSVVSTWLSASQYQWVAHSSTTGNAPSMFETPVPSPHLKIEQSKATASKATRLSHSLKEHHSQQQSSSLFPIEWELD